MTDVWDIVKPLDEWERYYAHMEYLRYELKAIGATKIEVN